MPINYKNPNFIPIEATGGNITEPVIDGKRYKIHAFTDVGSDTFEVTNAGSDGVVEYLIVAGGGGGGAWTTGSGSNNPAGGGGGAGGLLNGFLGVSPQSYPVIVGGGGTGKTNTLESAQGGSSSAFGVTAVGGGRGGSRSSTNGGAGGSGGGGANGSNGGAGTSGQGFAGQNSVSSRGGGGGGFAATGVFTTGRAGTGGDGLFVDWADVAGLGDNGYFAGGGGGSGRTGSFLPGFGGLGGGGNAVQGVGSGDNGEDGQANTGGGGGAAEGSANLGFGGNGGSGIVIIRYPLEKQITQIYKGENEIKRIWLGDNKLVFGAGREYELIADVNVTTATTQIDFDNLNITKDDELRLVFTFVGDSTTTANYLLRANDITSNYHIQELNGIDTSILAVRASNNRFAFARSNRNSSGFADIKVSNNNRFVAQSQFVYRLGSDSNNIQNRNKNLVNTSTVTSITKLSVVSDRTNGIAVGSRLQLYKVVR